MANIKTPALFFVLALFAGLSAAETGDGGLPGYWLNQGAGARALALGGAYTALGGDASALYWNPAGLALVKRKELSLTHVQLFEETRNDFIVYAHPFSSLVLGLGGAQLYTGGIIKTDALNNPAGKFSDSYSTVLAGIGKEALENRLYFGFAAKSVSRSMDTYSVSGYGLDAGLLADISREKSPVELSLGLGVKNIVAPSLKREFLTDEFPLDVSAGAAVRLLERALVISADVRKKKGENARPSAGVEYNFDSLSLRAGYDQPDPTFGFGVKLGNVALDYALLSSREKELGLSHRLSLGLKFGRDADVAGRIAALLADGRTGLEAKKWRDAETSFKGVLELEQGRREAKEGLVAAYLGLAEEAMAGENPDRRGALAWCGEALKIDPANSEVRRKITGLEVFAVLDFTGKNVSQADASIVTDLMRTELVNTGAFNILDRANMDAILAEQKFQNSGCTEQDCAAQIGKLLNVTKMVVGSMSKLLETYHITVNLVDVQTGRILASREAEAADSKGLREACKTLAQKLLAQ